MNTLVIRRGVVSDALVLSEFAARTFSETFGASNRPEDMAVFLSTHYSVALQSQELNDPNVVVLLAFDDGVLIAYAQLRRNATPPCVTQSHPIELQRFYVDKPAHGKGVAQRLMQSALAVARLMGGEHVWLGVWEHNPRAIGFYRKYGFEDVGSVDFYVGSDQQTDRVFVANLSAIL